MLTTMIVHSPSRTYLVSPDPISGLAKDTPALSVMTDFAVDAPQTVPENRHIDDALNGMIVAGVRALVVVRDREVAGLITAHDILGEKPIKFLRDPACAGNPCIRHDIVVGDIMTHLELLETLELKWVQKSRACDLRSVFAHNSYTHMFVTEPGTSRNVRRLRGLVSRTRLERHLGAPIPISLA